ncbi:MAG: diguanylate cyclase [Betaproteobacteria bacterium]
MPVSEDLFREMKTGGNLPSPSGVALRLIDLTRREDATLDEIARAMQADPALCGRLIRFANMAFNGPRRPVVSIAEAIRRVGLNLVRQLVLGFSVLGHNRLGKCRSFDYSRFWARSLATAIAANVFCLRVRAASAEEAFTCGLFSDIGSLAFATLFPREYADFIDANRDLPPGMRAELERTTFKTDHMELAGAILEDWKLPRFFVDAVQFHEIPESALVAQDSRDYLLLQLISLAAGVGEYCVSSEAQRKEMVPTLVLAAAKIGVDADALDTGINHISREWAEWGKILEVKTQNVSAFQQHASAVTESFANQAAAGSQHASMSMDILIADDDPTIRILLEQTLRNLGHKIAVAVDGREALKLAIDLNPQLVISDLVMPGIDGVQLCQALRDTEEGRKMYFILLTGMTEEAEMVEGFAAGADDYLTKPFNARVLTARLRAAERVIHMQEEAERDSLNLRRFATELAVSNRRLQQAALTDSLTGLPNRRHLMERIEQEWAIASRTERPLSVMMIDIDGFKQVNDVHGHEAGDQVLTKVAALLRQTARVEDVVGRLGGDEFVVICPAANATMGVRLAERLRQAVAQCTLHIGDISRQISISIGVSQRDPAMASVDELLQRADAALYRAKRDGRNRVSGLLEADPTVQTVKQ